MEREVVYVVIGYRNGHGVNVLGVYAELKDAQADRDEDWKLRDQRAEHKGMRYHIFTEVVK